MSSISVRGGVTASYEEARRAAFKPTAALYETYSRLNANHTQSLTAALVSGKQYFAGIYLPGGTVISSITFFSGAIALVAGTNQWFSIYNQSLQRWAVTVDDTSTAWGTQVPKTLAIENVSATAAGALGASSTFTVPASGFYYLGAMVAAATVPALKGWSPTASVSAGDIDSQAPVFYGNPSDTGLTNPASSPATAGAITANGWGYAYAYVS